MELREAIKRAETIKGWMNRQEMTCLWNLCQESRLVLELGALCGRSTFLMGKALEDRGILVSVDHHEGSPEHQPEGRAKLPGCTTEDGRINTWPTYLENTKELRNVIRIRDSFSRWHFHSDAYYDFIFIDGDHDYDSTFRDIIQWAPFTTKLLIHDYGNTVYPDVERAVADTGLEVLSVEGSIAVLKA